MCFLTPSVTLFRWFIQFCLCSFILIYVCTSSLTFFLVKSILMQLYCSWLILFWTITYGSNVKVLSLFCYILIIFFFSYQSPSIPLSSPFSSIFISLLFSLCHRSSSWWPKFLFPSTSLAVIFCIFLFFSSIFFQFLLSFLIFSYNSFLPIFLHL